MMLPKQNAKENESKNISVLNDLDLPLGAYSVPCNDCSQPTFDRLFIQI